MGSFFVFFAPFWLILEVFWLSGSLFEGLGGLGGSEGTPWTLGTLKGPKKGLRGPPPTPLRRVTFWLLFAKYYQKFDVMFILYTLFLVLLFEAKMDPLKEGQT